MKSPKLLALSMLGGILAISGANAAPIPGVVSEADVTGNQRQASPQSIEKYWTPERMRQAQPRPVPTVIVDEQSLAYPPDPQMIDGEPGFVPGCPPKATNCDTQPRSLPMNSIDSSTGSFEAFGDQISPMHGAKPINPKTGPYGPFQRWRESEPITAYPKSAIGKLFFTLGGKNFVCSASVIGRSTVITAGHCNSDGNGKFATNRLFCPSYNGAPHPTRDCWAVTTSVVAAPWHNGGDPDYDYSCLVMNTTGRKVASKIGNVTGTLGRAWNFAPQQAERTFGYPAATPFNGDTLQTTASTEWYTHDFSAGGQVSKVIGSDLTGGSSGGPWIIGWTGGLTETADTDGSADTDPGSNWVNGVNSHKRCLGSCFTPPTTTSGTFWQEMTSPPFSKTSSDNNDSEDVIAICLAHANNQ